MVKCEKCGKVNDKDANFCKNCGANLKNKTTNKKSQDCNECGYIIIGSPKFCGKCGTKIKKKKWYKIFMVIVSLKGCGRYWYVLSVVVIHLLKLMILWNAYIVGMYYNKRGYNLKKQLDLLSINKLDALIKLRIIVGLIFTLSTLSIILVFFVTFFIIAILILICYLLILVITIKLFRIKKL